MMALAVIRVPSLFLLLAQRELERLYMDDIKFYASKKIKESYFIFTNSN
jgi:hypothetical protein